jgi:16S rRNA (cytosine967-C5)-methyltransferase
LAVNVLQRWQSSGVTIDTVLNPELERSRLAARDRHLVTELVNGTLRMRGTLDYILESLYHRDFQKMPHTLRIILEISLYQLIYTSRIPDYAAIDEAVKLGRKINGEEWTKIINGILRSYLRKKRNIQFPDIDTQPALHISTRYSHPLWLVKRWISLYGMKNTVQLCQANNRTPAYGVRVNTLRTDTAGLEDHFKKNDVQCRSSKYLPEFLVLEKIPTLSKDKLFNDGFYSVQDESAGLVSKLAAPVAGNSVIDLCAAPGGKSTHLAELTADDIDVLAVDVDENRLRYVRESAERLGLKRIRTVCADATEYNHAPVDIVLADVPCSGLGVLAKRSDLRWRRSHAQVNAIKKIQTAIIENAARLVKKGGVLIYSTCTIEPEENEKIVEKFLNDHSQFDVENPAEYVDASLVVGERFVYTYPHKHQMDGSFCVRLKKL